MGWSCRLPWRCLHGGAVRCLSYPRQPLKWHVEIIIKNLQIKNCTSPCKDPNSVLHRSCFASTGCFCDAERSLGARECNDMFLLLLRRLTDLIKTACSGLPMFAVPGVGKLSLCPFVTSSYVKSQCDTHADHGETHKE